MSPIPSQQQAPARISTSRPSPPARSPAHPAPPRRRRAWLAADIAGLQAAVVLEALVFSDGVSLAARATGCAVAVLALALFGVRGAYDPQTLRGHVGIVDEARETVVIVSLSAMATITASTVAFPQWEGAPVASRVWLASVLLVIAARTMTRAVARRRGPQPPRPVLVVGAGRVGARLERRLGDLPEVGLKVVGFLDSDPVPSEELPSRKAPVLGGVNRLTEALRETGARHVILAFSTGSDRTLLGVVRRCRELGVGVWVVPRLFDSANARLGVDYVGGMPVFRLQATARHVELRLKGVLDRVAAIAAVLLLAPLLAAIAAAVRFRSPGPLLFRQRRVGRDGISFDMLKFRSMRVQAPSAGPHVTGEAQLALHDPSGPGGVEGEDRRTRVGAFLRRTSLDELPQLFNIARGDMSFVGPRPERPQFVELFADSVERYSDRHRMKSGLTGWAQVHGLRGQTSLVKRVEWDNWYIDNWSLWLDLKVVLMTAGAMRKGAS